MNLSAASAKPSKKYRHPLEKVGKTLVFIGLPLTAIGAIMVSDADALYYNCVNGDCEGDPRGGFGVVFLSHGIGLSITGLALWSTGSNKTKARRSQVQ